MFNKLNMKWLAGTFALLLILAVAITMKNKSNKSTSKNRTFTSELLEFDSAKVTQIIIQPKFEASPVDLVKQASGWKVKISRISRHTWAEPFLGGM